MVRFSSRSVLLCMVLMAASRGASALTLTNLHEFAPPELGFPGQGLTQGRDGNFYGTTGGGGSDTDYGSVFQITPAGTLTTLYTFGQGNDGLYPSSSLVQSSDGFFYGVTWAGGNNDNGTVFKVSSAGTFTTIHYFTGDDGNLPDAALIQGADGNFYGTTLEGGTNGGGGTVFKMTPDGTLTTLHGFGSGVVGIGPRAGLVQGRDGNFYGMNENGGTNGVGTVFKMTPAGKVKVLHTFSGGVDGGGPTASLIEGDDGWFYGTTASGGTNGNYGTVFKISSAGAFIPLHDFNGSTDGAVPIAPLLQGSDGNFYGTTSFAELGPNYGSGGIFKITPEGTLTTLWQFSDPVEGGIVYSAIAQGVDGDFYGTTWSGGTNHNGTVFKFSLPFHPPPNQISGLRFARHAVVAAVPSVSGETYQLQCRESMTSGDWSNVPGAVVSNSLGGPLLLTNAISASTLHRFYRLDITP